MEDKKLFITFISITAILNLFLFYLLIKGLLFYVNDFQNIQNSQKLFQDFKTNYDQYKINTNIQKQDLTVLKNRYSGTTSISGYIEKLVFKTNEKNVQLYKNTVVTSNDKEIIMEVTLFGTFDSISRVIKEIEDELPLTEITGSTVEVSGKLYRVNLNLRILIGQND